MTNTQALATGTTVINHEFANRYAADYATLMVTLSPIIETGPFRGMVPVEWWEDGTRQTDNVWADELVSMKSVLQSAMDEILTGKAPF